MPKDPLIIGEIKEKQLNGAVYPVVSPSATVAAKAADATLTASDMGKNITNTGASGTVALTLPAVSESRGKYFRVQVTAAEIVQLDPGTSSVYLGGSGVADKYAQLAGVIGNYADVYCDGTDWLITAYSGVATKEA